MNSTEIRMPRMMGLPPKIWAFTVMRLRRVSPITVIGCFRYSEHFVRQDIVDSKRFVGHVYRGTASGIASNKRFSSCVSMPTDPALRALYRGRPFPFSTYSLMPDELA